MPVGSGGGGDAVPARLRSALARILARSLPRLRPLYLPRATPAGAGAATMGGPGAGGPGGGSHAPGAPEAGPPADAARPTPLCHPGNMHGLLERKVSPQNCVRAGNILELPDMWGGGNISPSYRYGCELEPGNVMSCVTRPAHVVVWPAEPAQHAGAR